MKKIKIFLLAIAAIISFTQCESPVSEKVLDKQDVRGKMISALMNNDTYMKEVMDSMKVKHGGGMPAMGMEKGNMKMDESMMKDMMEKCKNDTAMCKMMMNTTMAMCAADSSMCKMMMTSMNSYPSLMRSMEGMKGMKIEPKKK